MEGKLPEAIAAYREALRWNPRLREAHVDLGAALVDVGESARAKEHLSRALELKRGAPAALTRLAAALLGEGRTAEAGRFGEAIATARRAANLARSQGLDGLVSEIAARQARYEAHQPFRSAARAVR